MVKPSFRLGFLTLRARLVFIKWSQVFIKVSIFYYFDPKCHIRIKTNAFGYAINGVFNQLVLDDSGQWHLVIFFFRKIISAETWYKTYNGKLLAIIETFKIWCHYLEHCKYKVFIFSNHNNFYWPKKPEF